MDLGKLEVWIEENDAQPRSTGRLRGQNPGEGRQARQYGWVARIERVRELRAWDGGAGKRIVYRRVDDTAVVDAVSAANGGLAIAKHIPSEPNSGRKIVLVTREALGLRNRRIREDDAWQHFVFVTQA